jgi:hypothetical protein
MNLQIVPLKNNILVDFKKQDIKNKIIERINELKLNIPLYKNDNEFLTLVCNLIEYLVNSKKDNINKKEMVLMIYQELFGLTPDEQETLKNNIDIIHLQNKIKKVSMWKLFKCGFKEFFLKKSTK